MVYNERGSVVGGRLRRAAPEGTPHQHPLGIGEFLGHDNGAGVSEHAGVQGGAEQLAQCVFLLCAAGGHQGTGKHRRGGRDRWSQLV